MAARPSAVAPVLAAQPTHSRTHIQAAAATAPPATRLPPIPAHSRPPWILGRPPSTTPCGRSTRVHNPSAVTRKHRIRLANSRRRPVRAAPPRPDLVSPTPDLSFLVQCTNRCTAAHFPGVSIVRPLLGCPGEVLPCVAPHQQISGPPSAPVQAVTPPLAIQPARTCSAPARRMRFRALPCSRRLRAVH